MKKKKDRKIKFEQKRKLKKIMIAIISFIITICVLYNVLFLINTTISQKDYFHVFGISFFSVKTDLMENDLYKNNFVIVKEVTDSDLQVGDIIVWVFNCDPRECTAKCLNMNLHLFGRQRIFCACTINPRWSDR